MQTTATIAKELLKGGISPTAEALQKSTGKQQQLTTSYFYRPKDQLLYLADLLNFQVHFSDFPKVCATIAIYNQCGVFYVLLLSLLMIFRVIIANS